MVRVPELDNFKLCPDKIPQQKIQMGIKLAQQPKQGSSSKKSSSENGKEKMQGQDLISSRS